jgi:cysteine desulfurase
MQEIYLDYAATTPCRPEVSEAMCAIQTEEYGNPSSLHRYGQRSKRALEQSRRQVAALLGIAPETLIFTAGGTDSDNLAIQGAAQAAAEGRRHLITTAIEHHAVLHTMQHLEGQGYEVTYLPVDAEGVVRLDALAEALRPDTLLVSVMLANNETGAIQPLAEIVELARPYGALVHTDAVQAVGKLPVDVEALGVDLLSLTAHKFYGPRGVGALYVRPGAPITPLRYGGSQEHKLHPGTENVAGIVGLTKALELAEQERPAEAERLRGLAERLEQGILARISDATRNGPPAERRLPHILNMSFGRVEGESVLLALDSQGIAVSTGSACASGAVDPSHVLLAMGVSRARAAGSVRFSLGRSSTGEEMDRTVDTLARVIESLRAMAPAKR